MDVSNIYSFNRSVSHIAIQILISLAAGTLLGAVYFGGLWWTVARLPRSRYPWLLVPLSALLRTIFVLAGMWLVGIQFAETNQLMRLAVCLFGFLISRFFITRLINGPDSISRELSR